MKNHKIDIFGNVVSKNPLLRDVFIMPPFSVMDAREGNWQKRKRQWIEIGIQSELGRGEDILFDNGRVRDLDYYRKRNKACPGGSPRLACDYSNREKGDGRGRPLVHSKKLTKKKVNGLTFSSTGFMADIINKRGGGTSIFDPVLCELMYKWFCPANGKIFDPFAGGSVRGIVANYLGYHYTGIDLSKNQIESNRQQARKILKGNEPK